MAAPIKMADAAPAPLYTGPMAALEAAPSVNALNPVEPIEWRSNCPAGQNPADAPFLYADITSRMPGVFATLAQDESGGILPPFVEGAKSDYRCPAAYAPTPGDSDLGDWVAGAFAYGEQLDPRSSGIYNAEPAGDFTVGMAGIRFGAQERLEDAEAIEAAENAELAKRLMG